MIQIDVTAEDITQGDPRSANSCPIARAAKRCLGVEWVSVIQTDIKVYSPSKVYFDLPAEATRFIVEFDKGMPVEPFSFQVEAREAGLE